MTTATKSQPLSDWITKPYSIVPVVIGLFILTCVISLILCHRQFETTKHNALVADKTMANLLTEVIQERERAVIGILQSYASQPLFVDIVKKKNPLAAHLHLANLKKNHEIDLTFVTDKKGVLWANYPVFPEAIGKDLSDRDWYKGTSSKWKPYISTVFKLIVGDKPLAVAICVPVFDEKGRPIGVLANSHRLSFLSDTIQRVPLSAYTSVTFIDRTGHILYSNKYPFQEKIVEYPSYPMIEQTLKEKRQQVELVDQLQNQAISYMTIVSSEDTGWTVIVERSLKDILRTEYRNFIVTGAFSLLLFLMVSFSLVYSRKVFLLRRTEELLQAEIRLRESEGRYRVLVDSAPDAVIVHQSGQFLYANYNALKLYRADTLEQLQSKTVLDLIHPDERAAIAERMQRGQSGQSVELRETKLVSLDGQVIPVESVGGVINYEGRPAVQIIIRDITERKRAEEALRESDERLLYALATSHTGAWDLNLEDHSASRSLEHDSIFGYTELLPEWTYEMFLGHVLPEDRDAVDAKFRHAVQTESDWSFDCRIRRSDGEIRWIWAAGRHRRPTSGGPLHMAGIVQDITDRKKAEDAIKEHAAKLEEANKELESFSYSVSHDLRAPLRAIDGYARMILKKQGDKFDEDTLRKFNDIRLNARMMGKLIDDLLTFSRLSRKDMSKSQLNMVDLIREEWKELNNINPDRKMNLIVNSTPLGYGDAALIKQVYHNLLSNAVKYTKVGDYAQIEVGGYNDGNEDVFYVKDNGVGFDMKYYDKLFGIFQRLHNNPDFEGTGVGLATVQRIVHRQGGRVWAEGKVNEGATFYFTLPHKGDILIT